MFTAEIEDRVTRRQDGPHQTLRWRKKVRILAQHQAENKMRVSLESAIGKFEDESEHTHQVDMVSARIDLETVMNGGTQDCRLSMSDAGFRSSMEHVASDE